MSNVAHLLGDVRRIITHYHCPDGIFSALFLLDVMPGLPVQFIQYNTPEHRFLKADPGMLFCDFTPYDSRVSEFVDSGAIVLDHHAKAKDIVGAFGDRGVFADEHVEPEVSGAVLAFRHVWEPLKSQSVSGLAPDVIADLARLAGIRDLWRRQHPDFEEALALNELMLQLPRDWLIEKGLAGVFSDSRFRSMARPYLEEQWRKVHKVIGEALRMTTQGGTRVVIFEGTGHTTNAAEIIHEDADLVIGFRYTVERDPDGRSQIKLICSTRSHTTFDCLGFCSQHAGGGGHLRAAGCEIHMPVDAPNPYQHIVLLIEQFERKQLART